MSKLIKKYHDGNYITYTVQPNDTLSTIAKRLTGDANNYNTIAAVNGIDDVNKIYVGDKLTIPTKFNTPLKQSEIPTKNRVNVIDNFSPNYNYIIEGDKIYYSRKGNDHWVDISDNDKARTNLFNFIGNKYNFRGYEDNESEIWNQIKQGTYQYGKQQESMFTADKYPLLAEWGFFDEPQQQDVTTVQQQPVTEQEQRPVVNLEQYLTEKPAQTEEYVEPEEPRKTLKELWGMGQLWLSRRLSPNDETLSNLPEPVEIDSQYGIRPGSYTGDTIFLFRKQIPDDRRYILPESLDMSEFTFGHRNRGEYNQISSEGAPITAFHNFKPYGKHDTNFKTFIGIDPQGRLKVGGIDQFGEGDYLTGTFSNDIARFKKDEKGNYVYTQSKANTSRNQPVPVLWGENGEYEIPNSQAINLLVNRGNLQGTYGNITGGRILIRVGNELRLVSGSVEDIDREFEAMKARNHQPYGTFYTLDNGSYNIGLRTVDNTFTPDDLRQYDLRNRGGGNFLYISGRTPDEFRSDTILTPNVRTVDSESYKKGHALENEQKGVLLHHTAFMEPDLTGVVNYLTNPANPASSHVVIGYDGTRKVLATPDKVTFHAGHSVWNNRDNVNDFMIGIEFQGDTNKQDLTEEQIRSVVEYLKPIIRENNIKLEDITTHEQVRNLYNDYAKKQKMKPAAAKHDINQRNYERIIKALLEEVYYRKFKSGGRLIPKKK